MKKQQRKSSRISVSDFVNGMMVRLGVWNRAHARATPESVGKMFGGEIRGELQDLFPQMHGGVNWTNAERKVMIEIATEHIISLMHTALLNKAEGEAEAGEKEE